MKLYRGISSPQRLLISIILLGTLLPTLFTPPVSRAETVPAFADPAFQNVWARTDQPIAAQKTIRSWLWGPAPFKATTEPYKESPFDQRLVQYFDKARMEITYPKNNPQNPYFVTNGLLVVEMMSGRLQAGDNTFLSFPPSTETIAGDTTLANPGAPTYATFANLATLNGSDNFAPDQTGQNACNYLDEKGNVHSGDSQGLKYAYFEQTLHHNIPDVFWTFLQQKGLLYDGATNKYITGKIIDWTSALGYPLTEAYWTTVKVGGKSRLVLVQAFQRRVLTYTPLNDPQWKVEMGNVGRHYNDWRSRYYFPSWSWRYPLPGTNYLTNVRCQTTDLCFAVGKGGTIIRTTDGRKTWTMLNSGTRLNLIALSCPNATTCFIVGEGNVILVTHNGGQTWEAQESPKYADYRDIVCPSDQLCYAVGTDRTVIMTTNGGMKWSLLATNIQADLTRISCPSVSTCFAVDLKNHLIVTFDSGSNWTPQGDPSTYFGSLDCPTTTICYATGKDDTILGTKDGGNTWTVQHTATIKNVLLNAMTCASSTTCLAKGFGGLFLHTTDGGNTWSITELDQNLFLRGTHCPTTTICVAVGDNGTILNTNDSGNTWTVAGEKNVRDTLKAISCPTANICYVVGYKTFLKSTDGGKNWGVGEISASEGLTAINCFSETTCIAVGYSNILKTTDGGKNWISPPDGTPGLNSGLTGLSCPDLNTCFATGQQGGLIVATRDGGATWTKLKVVLKEMLLGISCPTKLVCFAVGTYGQIVATTDGGNTWSQQVSGLPPLVSITSINCPTTKECFATTYGTILKTHDGGMNWIEQRPDRGYVLAGITCLNETDCIIVGNGTILATTNGGVSWANQDMVKTGDHADLNGVACLNLTYCLAVGDEGGIVTNSPNSQ